ncbi:hypothetical protein Oter_2863 [Opitutus terrae PB90-1]|uniref:Uncharacterized protein n=2 Tax=Opitutus terrae TaxID=107709 RepID=B1ZX92_OPITP|nr:hypothetical protein Oter_2863 [Opitutus terrae PB90-1]
MPAESADQDSQVVGLFVAGPIGALVGRVLAASMKNAALGTISPLDFESLAPKQKSSATASDAGKKSKLKPGAGSANSSSPDGKAPARKRRKRRGS